MVQVADRAVNMLNDQSLVSQRERAKAVLAELKQARSACEEHGNRLNRSDLYKTVTGRSALDAAISSTERMIETLDRTLAKATLEVEVRASALLNRQRTAAR
ncbi:MAG: hypothetical protein JNK58_10455 [Phycisphaerae bacterium]|nr:hypothetical protein [Phycisphaerae bacterium]